MVVRRWCGGACDRVPRPQASSAPLAPLTSPVRSGTALASSRTPTSASSVSAANGVPAGSLRGVVTVREMVQPPPGAAAPAGSSRYGAAQRTPNNPGHWRGCVAALSSGMSRPHDPGVPSPQRPARSASVSDRSDPTRSASAQKSPVHETVAVASAGSSSVVTSAAPAARAPWRGGAMVALLGHVLWRRRGLARARWRRRRLERVRLQNAEPCERGSLSCAGRGRLRRWARRRRSGIAAVGRSVGLRGMRALGSVAFSSVGLAVSTVGRSPPPVSGTAQ